MKLLMLRASLCVLFSVGISLSLVFCLSPMYVLLNVVTFFMFNVMLFHFRGFPT